MTVSLDLGAALSAAVPFVGHLGLSVEADQHQQRVVLPDSHFLGNHVGTRHAGALFTAAETASGAAVLALLGRNELSAVPLVGHAEIRYQRPARGAIAANPSPCRTDAEVTAALAETGRAEVPVQVELTDDDGVTVATGWFSWVLRQRETSR